MKSISAAYLKKIEEMRKACSIAFSKNLIDTHSGNISCGDALNNELIITKTGASLINLEINDFTIAPLETADTVSSGSYYATDVCEESSPSSEIAVHRFIAKSYPDSYILHTHPETAIALSINNNYRCSNNKYIYNFEDFNENKDDMLTLDRKNADKKNLNIDAIFNLFKIYPELKILKPADFEASYFFPLIYIFPLNFIDDIKSNKKNNINFKINDIFADYGIFIIKYHGCFAWGKTALDALRWTMMLESSSKILYMLNTLLSTATS
jgi:ribulose-5-phosphate 4-epimerase/fuculose-1-phosphate aldolase